jgi:UPF0716 protein FxsA
VLGRLLLLFTLVPLVELYLLIGLGGQIGLVPTLGMIAVTGLLGAWLAKREGRKALASYRDALEKGRLPEDGIVSGLLILVGGVLLIAPGVLTDVVGLLLMIPPIRRGVAKLITARAAARIASGDVQVIHLEPESMRFGPGLGGNLGNWGGNLSGNLGSGVVDVEVVDTSASRSS